ncbi:hypothetical protein Q4575_05415 [Psychrosphaera sp. 1_MG-2023]|uniref:hypothetical protein n=1 Tax=Psychrosphaera sp. 1_MG-2023 TaxID=3062643 RepID=UPI0026E39274|nr:hypothetical protein [Psychrosphaera sp. 1_MG-2023]MDO6718829.1 hypothetical protein [Psychrosphaera sp. 1_MG-2023]
MTTTVCDLENGIITADTRWSAIFPLNDGNELILYCDDTTFDKICIVGKAALLTAGDGTLIAKWKEWWMNDRNPTTRPITDNALGENAVNLAIVDLVNNDVIFDAGQKNALFCLQTNVIKAFAAGSGGIHAASHLLNTGCAISAVKEASKEDYYTGSEVKFLNFDTTQNNLEPATYDYGKIVNGLIKRGRVMTKQANTPTDVGLKVQDHPLYSDMKKALKTGQAIASAPVPGLSRFKWTNDTEKKFTEAMDRVAELT